MATAGAAMGVAARFPVGPQYSANAQTSGLHWAKVKFDISDLNPLWLVFDEVKKQVETDSNRPAFPTAPAPDSPRWTRR
jgi:hypothetical protein